VTAIIFRLTLQQLLSRKRFFAMLALATIPIGLAVIVRMAADDIDRVEWTTGVLYQAFIVGTVLPLVALVFGTAALGSEFEDGTAVYLLTKPIRRSAIVVPKIVAAWLTTSAIMVASGGIAGAILLGGEGEARVVAGFTVGMAAGALAYTAAFVMLSVVTGRALIAGMVYVFLWEGVITGIFRGTRVMSVREYTLAIGDLFAGTPDSVFNPRIDGTLALVLLVAVTGFATWYAIRALERWEMTGGG